MIWYDMIYLSAIGLTPGGSSTVHIYTQTVHRTTHSTQTIHRTHTNTYICMIPSNSSVLQLRCLGWIAQMNFFISSWTVTVCAHLDLSLFTLKLLLVSPSLFRSPQGTGVRDYLPPYCPHVSTIYIAIGSRFQVRRLRVVFHVTFLSLSLSMPAEL